MNHIEGLDTLASLHITCVRDHHRHFRKARMSRLTTLPAEIRVMIWEEVVPRDNAIMLMVRNRRASESIDGRRFSEFTIFATQYSAQIRQSIKDALALSLVNRQTSGEVRAIFFANNRFIFGHSCLRGSEFDHRRLRWTLPGEFGAYVKHVQIEVPRICFFSEPQYRAAKGVLELIATAMSGQGSKPSPLHALNITFTDYMSHSTRFVLRSSGFEFQHDQGASSELHFLEPLVALAQRKVQQMSCSFASCGLIRLPSFQIYRVQGLEDFMTKLQRVLLEGIEMKDYEVDLMDEAVFGYNVFAPTYDWDDPEFKSSCD